MSVGAQDKIDSVSAGSARLCLGIELVKGFTGTDIALWSSIRESRRESAWLLYLASDVGPCARVSGCTYGDAAQCPCVFEKFF